MKFFYLEIFLVPRKISAFLYPNQISISTFSFNMYSSCWVYSNPCISVFGAVWHSPNTYLSPKSHDPDVSIQTSVCPLAAVYLDWIPLIQQFGRWYINTSLADHGYPPPPLPPPPHISRQTVIHLWLSRCPPSVQFQFSGVSCF